jgi:hypothetical protein
MLTRASLDNTTVVVDGQSLLGAWGSTGQTLPSQSETLRDGSHPHTTMTRWMQYGSPHVGMTLISRWHYGRTTSGGTDLYADMMEFAQDYHPRAHTAVTAVFGGGYDAGDKLQIIVNHWDAGCRKLEWAAPCICWLPTDGFGNISVVAMAWGVVRVKQGVLNGKRQSSSSSTTSFSHVASGKFEQ